MVYGQLRTLVSLLIILCLGGGFLWTASHILGTVTGTPPLLAPPATPTPLLESPTLTATPKAIKKPPIAVAPKRATSTPVRSPTPRPRPTPQGPPRVAVALSPTDYTGATRFNVGALTASGIPRLYCQVRDSALPPNGGALTYTWSKDTPNGFLYSYTIARAAGAYTTGYFQSPALANPGTYRCDVTVVGRPFGSAHFTVTP